MRQLTITLKMTDDGNSWTATVESMGISYSDATIRGALDGLSSVLSLRIHDEDKAIILQHFRQP